ncbi:hypothetical protein M9H77_15947 [Catharanthus roseus]|uniref:Uncharacterized protein n=1 Tax=Catharanthus roseus TaxID=4058 RepID=A0ACC0AZV1_CATRO|nr:hypothetical protein M9H77_15947 [Catharanthus roseus]
MEEIGSFWSYQENVDELKQKLLCTTLELEQLKVEANEELRKNKEYVKQLMQLLRMVSQERDEAREQFQKLLNKVMPSAEFFNGLPQFQSESPLVKPTKANSSITESNSLSETYNYHSHGSSPGDSFFDAVSSPELSNINMADSSSIAFVNQPLVQDCKGLMPNNLISSGIPKIDQASLVIENLAKGKSLPQRGKFLKAVLDSGPLLQNLLVAGPLPRWRNPPQLQTFHIPPVSIKGCDADVINQKNTANMNQFGSRSLVTSRPYAEMSCASAQILSTSMLNFGNGPSGSCMSSDRLISAGANANAYIALGKRQRLH